VSAPATLAGALALMNAEMLAALVIIQLHRPGAAAVYAGYPAVMDLRKGTVSFGIGELGLLSAGCIEIGRYYGLPTASNGLTADACTADPMAVADKWASGYLPALAGANLNGGAGTLGSQSTISLEQLVIDNDLYGSIFRHIRGIEVSAETLAGDVIQRVGPRGSYIGEDHTRIHCRTEYWYSGLANRLSPPSWEAAGSVDAAGRAVDTVHAILDAPHEPLLTETQLSALSNLRARAELELEQVETPV